jgi:16S rRNA (adenine1518-N6/adenine1519-N6)-dimethyltransferase
VSNRPKRSLGQNFLQDESVITRIVDALDLTPADTVIEIGPGRGALTGQLLERAERVIAIEFDRDLVPKLERVFGPTGKFELVNSDALDVDFAEVMQGAPRKLVANLPYNISTPILQRLIAQREMFTRLVLMFQREVADRITAKPGEHDRGFLSVLVEKAFTAKRLFDVPPDAFYPKPKVWSSVVCLTPRAVTEDEKQLRDLVSIAFAHRRKTILNNLKPRFADAVSVLAAAAIDPQRRPETLTLDEWLSLTKLLHIR